jgi:hypothetical protein
MNTEQMNTHEPEAESAEYVQEMVEKGEQLERNNDPNQAERPDWLPEKFESAEQMAEAYANLENKMGSQDQEEYEEVSDEDADDYLAEDENEEVEYDENTQAGDVQDAVENAGIDFGVLQNEYNELGGLTEDAYGALEEAGFSQDLVDSWIAGQEALANNYQTSVYDSVGGEEAYSNMIEWAADNFSQAEIASYDRAVNSGDTGMAQLAVEALSTRYQAAEGVEPSFIQGETANSAGGNYSSWSEVTAAMKDSRYESDPAYRQQVTNKLARSNVS